MSMLFNSLEFIHVFLPAVIVIYYLISRFKREKYIPVFLLISSMIFYSYWDYRFLLLLAFSIMLNFFFGKYLYQHRRKIALAVSIIINILVLSYFKYFNFFIQNLNDIANTDFNFINVILPLGISFFTFSQISFLVDCYYGRTSENNIIVYALFVMFFPHISAGPIAYHREMAPQYRNTGSLKFSWNNLSAGIILFTLGLFKKSVIADNLSQYVVPIFDNSSGADTTIVLDIVNSWKASIAYTFQLYFDFSGYSDMALGIANIFGIKLPVNFLSPYKSRSIVEFWKRWHMTLSRFFRDYVFLPVSFSLSRAFKSGSFFGTDTFIYSLGILVTWSLTGLWHGAGWTFILWGILHAMYLVLNRILKKPKKRALKKCRISAKNQILSIFYLITTFISVHIAWIYFRAPDFITGNKILKGMLGLMHNNPSTDSEGVALIVFSGMIIFFLPNSLEFLADLKLGLSTYGQIIEQPKMRFLKFSYNLKWSFITALILLIGMIFVHSVQKMEFIYNDF